MSLTLITLAVIALTAHFVETVTGFGATIIALALAAHFVPLPQLLAVLVILGLVQSAYILVRDHRAVALSFLLKKVLPWTGLGLLLGLQLFNWLDAVWLKRVLGLFVAVLASWNLFSLFAPAEAKAQSLQSPVLTSSAGLFQSRLLLFAGGIFHGLFASGGPLVVSALSREIQDKRVFRASLASLWIGLNGFLLLSFMRQGRYAHLPWSVLFVMLMGLVLGIVFGELWHRRLSMQIFQRLVQGLLLCTGLFLLFLS